jgi:hypothetical protein
MKLAGISLGRGQKAVKPSFTNLHHELAVAHIRTIYESHGAKWLSESRIKSDFAGHLPDGLVTINGLRIIVEVDRTRKNSSRLDSIISENALSGCGDFIDYWVTTDLMPVFNRHLQSFSTDISSKVRIYLIPEELNR